ncbi:MAG: DUF342 domain-containing protein [Spirochaetota bacterium]
MKITIFYFDPNVNRMFVEKTSEETGEKSVVLSSPYNFVMRDEIVARVIEVDDVSDVQYNLDSGYTYNKTEKFKPFKAGEGINYDEFAGCYRASGYGFVIFDRQSSRIKLKPALQVTKDKLKAYYIVFPTKFMKIPSYKDIEEELMSRNIVAVRDKDEIEEELNQVNLEKPTLHRILVAKGREPVDGYKEYFLPLVEFQKKAGKLLEDGRIDFKEVGSIIEVSEGQEILQKIPEQKPEDGYDIYGDPATAQIVDKNGYQLGKNIVPSPENQVVYVSSIDGCLDVDNRKISVLPVAVIKGHVDYETGNIDFNGSVHVMGSVLPGFFVKAKGDIVVEKNVDDAYLEADGDITVQLGIGGKGESVILSGGSVHTKYIINSKVEAVNLVEAEDSIINSRVIANDAIRVTAKHGKIIGGDTIARHEIQVNVSGSPQETITNLVVGRSLFVERELAELRKDLDKQKSEVDETLKKIKNSFGEEVFKNPKEFIAILPPVKKKNCLVLLKELSESNKSLKVLLEQRKEIEEKYKLERDPFITINDRVYPGTNLSIKKSKRKIDKEMSNARFFEDPEEKVIRFSSAN